MRNFFKFLKDFFTKYKPTRVYVKDVKPGEIIVIEWSKIQNGIGNVTCVNNDTKTKKILIKINWSNFKEVGVDETEFKIFSYYSKELKDFNLLNGITRKVYVNSEDNIESLQKELDEAISLEEYEKADLIEKILFINLNLFSTKMISHYQKYQMIVLNIYHTKRLLINTHLKILY